MWDMKTGRSRGYGFVAFRERPDAEKALASMDGEWLGSRAIRCNWANQKGQPSISQQQAMAAMGMTPTTPFGHHHFPTHGVQSYDMVVQQTPQWQTTCYVGNLTPYTTQNDLVPLFQNFGFVVETRFQSDRGFAFVKMDTHENAAMAICQLSGYNVNGRPLKCSVSGMPPPICIILNTHIILVGQGPSSNWSIRRLFTTRFCNHSRCIQRSAIPLWVSSIRWSGWSGGSYDTSR
jgi:nucleolysin TIA-1/TIAR